MQNLTSGTSNYSDFAQTLGDESSLRKKNFSIFIFRKFKMAAEWKAIFDFL